MTPPIRPEAGSDLSAKIRKAQQAGYSMDEITSWLEQNGDAQQAKELRGAKAPTAKNLMVQAAEGVGGGFLRPMAAAGGTLVQKLSGDDRPMGEIYGQLKDDIDTKSDEYRAANPKKALGAQLTAAVLTARANPLSLLKGPGNAATMSGRALNSGLVSGATSGGAGFMNAHGDLKTRLQAGAEQGMWGAGAGVVASPVMDAGASLVKGGYRMLPQGVRDKISGGAQTAVRTVRDAAADAIEPTAGPRATPMLDRVRSTAATAVRGDNAPPLDPGAVRVLSLLESQGISMEQLRAASNSADDYDMIAEVIGERGVRALTTARLLGTRPDAISRTLNTRAAGENDQFSRNIERLTGTRAQDVRTMRGEVDDAIAPVTGPLYEGVENLPADPRQVRGIMQQIATLEGDGVPIWRGVRQNYGNVPPSVTDEAGEIAITDMSVGQLLSLRRTLDNSINFGANPMNLTSAESNAARRLETLRGQVDEAVKAAGGDPSGAMRIQLADEVTANARRGVSAFDSGEKGKARTLDELNDQRERSGHPEMFRQGKASSVLKQIAGKKDGGAGVVQNPATVLDSDPTARLNARAGFRDDASFEEALQRGEAVTNRLRTRNTVTGGSPTAERAVDVMEQAGGVANPLEAAAQVGSMVANPAGAASGLAKLWQPVGRRVLGQDMDAMAPYLLAGGPEQMTREEARKMLAKMEPALRAKWAQEMMTRGAVGNTAAREARGKR